MKGAASAAVLHSAGDGTPAQVLALGAMARREAGARFRSVSVGAAKDGGKRDPRAKAATSIEVNMIDLQWTRFGSCGKSRSWILSERG